MKYIVILISIVFVTCFSFSQTNDTIYIYETVEIYDTVFVYDTVYRNIEIDIVQPKDITFSLLQIDTITKKANLILISDHQTTTLPIHSININENFKIDDDMKKIKFLGLVMIAANSMLFAQTDFGITTGGGVWWAHVNQHYVMDERFAKDEYTAKADIGFYFQQNLQSGLFIESKLNYSFLSSNYSYKTSFLNNPNYGIGWEVDEHMALATIEDPNYCGIVGEGESASQYHHVSIPLNIGYNLGKISPYLGAEYAYRISEEWLGEKIHCYGLNAGASYLISNKVKLGINYYYGLSKDYEYTGHTIDCNTFEILETNKYNWKSRHLTLSISYNLAKTKTKQID